ncbi:MAG TPA: response regulator [Opitutus sp.]|nr:response regulator [Opitutus sp.]
MSCVLVIDEYEPFRQTMEFCLPRFGYAALTARDADEAIRMGAERAIDIVLLDVGWRWVSGFVICEKLKREAKFERVPVVILSAIVNAAMEERARAAGAVEIVAKPFSWPDLLKVLAQHALPVAEPGAAPAQNAPGEDREDSQNFEARTN